MSQSLRKQVFLDSFWYDTAELTRRWALTQNFGNAPVVGAYGPSGRRGVRVGWGTESSPPFRNAFGRLMLSTDPWGMTSFYVRRSATDAQAVALAFLSNNDGIFLTLAWAPDGTFILVENTLAWFGFTTLETSDEAAASINTHYHLEWINKCHGSLGISRLYLNGSQVFEYTGDTGATLWTAMTFGAWIDNNIGTYSAANYDYSDVVIRSSRTARGTTPLGVRPVLFRRMQEVNGVYTDLTANGGTTQGDRVRDESGVDDDTTTLEGTAVGQRSSFKCDPVSSLGDIAFAQITDVAKISGETGSASVRGFLRYGGVDSDGDDEVVLSGDYTHALTPFQDIDGEPITPTKINDGESGLIIG